jgi:hypothetical protein
MYDRDRRTQTTADADAAAPAAQAGRTTLTASLDDEGGGAAPAATPSLSLKPEIVQAAAQAQAEHHDPLADHRLDVVTYQDGSGTSHQQRDPTVAYIERMNRDYNSQTPAQAGGERAADAMFAEHDGPKKRAFVLNEVSFAFVEKHPKHYVTWVIALVHRLAERGRKVIVATAYKGTHDEHVQHLWKTLGSMHNVVLGVETQVLGTDTEETARMKLTRSMSFLHNTLKIPKGHLYHVVNLASSPHGKGFGSNHATDAQFARNVGFEVAEARRQGYGGALGYGFIVHERVAQAWNAAWERPHGAGAWSKP